MEWTPARAKRRRAGLVAGVVVLLGVLAAVLVPLATRDDPADRQAAPAPTGSGAPNGSANGGPGGASNGAPGGTGGTGGTGSTGSTGSTGADRAGATTAPKPTAAQTTARTTGNPAPTTAAIPAGFTRYVDPRTGFSLAVPQGWRAVENGVRIDFDDPRSGRFLRIDTSFDPQDDPYANWLASEVALRKRAADYRRLDLRRVEYRGWNTADWEFLAFGNHVLNRNIRVSDTRAHAIYWSTPASQWDTASSKQVFDVAARTFQPAP